MFDVVKLIDTFMNSFLSMEAFTDQIITHWQLFKLYLSPSTLLIILLLELHFPLFDFFQVQLKVAYLFEQESLIILVIRDLSEFLALTEVGAILALLQHLMFSLQALNVIVKFLKLLKRWCQLGQVIIVFNFSG